MLILWDLLYLKSSAIVQEINVDLLEQSGYVTEALRHLHAAQGAAASESRENARQLSVQQQVGGQWRLNTRYISTLYSGCVREAHSCSISR